MDQKAALIFERKKEDRNYQFIVPLEAPFGEVFDVIFEMLTAAQEFSKQALDATQKSLEESKVKDAEAKKALEGPIEN
jgi:hypothetical protein